MQQSDGTIFANTTYVLTGKDGATPELPTLSESNQKSKMPSLSPIPPHQSDGDTESSPSSSLPRQIDAFYEEAYCSTSGSSSRLGFWMIFLALGIANCGDATEVGCMNFILSNKGFQEEMLQGDFKKKGALIVCSIFVGMLMGGLATGAYSDRLGRRPILLLGLSMNAFSGTFSALSMSVPMLCLCRFGAGLGVGAVVSSLITLATELSPPSKRGFYVTVVATFWTVGAVFVAVLAMMLFGKYDASWRIFALLCAAPSTVGLLTVWAFVPESARFLALRGKYEEATKSANQIANGMGYRGAPLNVEEIQSFFADSKKDSNATADTSKAVDYPTLSRMDSALEHAKDAATGIRNLYKKELRMSTTIPLQLIWFTLSFGSALCTWITKIFENLNVSDIYLTSLIFSVSNIPGNAVASVLMDKVGRKIVLNWSMILASVSLFLFANAARGDETSTTAAVFHACTFHAFLVSGWCAISCITSEMFPTDVRSTGLGACAALGRTAAIVASFVNGALVEKPSVLLLVASCSMLVGAFTPIAFGMVDLSNQHLRDVTPHTHGGGIGELFHGHGKCHAEGKSVEMSSSGVTTSVRKTVGGRDGNTNDMKTSSSIV